MIEDGIKSIHIRESIHDKLYEIKREKKLGKFSRVITYLLENQKTPEEIERLDNALEEIRKARLNMESMTFAFRDITQWLKQKHGIMEMPEDVSDIGLPLGFKIALQDAGINISPAVEAIIVKEEKTEKPQKIS